jgi:hypothetical protein
MARLQEKAGMDLMNNPAASAAGAFLRWCEKHGISDLTIIEPVHVAACLQLRDSYGWDRNDENRRDRCHRYSERSQRVY